ERFGTEVLMFGGFVGDPEAGSIDSKLRDYCAIRCVDAEESNGPESGRVELNCFRTVAHGKHGGDGFGHALDYCSGSRSSSGGGPSRRGGGGPGFWPGGPFFAPGRLGSRGRS